MLRDHHVDLILCDFGMPGRTGSEFVVDARRDGLIDDGLGVVCISGHLPDVPDPSVFTHCLQKPVGLDALRALVDPLLQPTEVAPD